MVGDNTKRDVLLFVVVIIDACNVDNMLHNIADGINLKKVVNALHDTRKSFKTHARVDIAGFKTAVIAVAVVIKLRENKVPELRIAVAVTTRAAGRRAAAVFFASVEVNLRARTART